MPIHFCWSLAWITPTKVNFYTALNGICKGRVELEAQVILTIHLWTTITLLIVSTSNYQISS